MASLNAVKQAAASRDRGRRAAPGQLIAAIQQARADGYSLAEIGKAIGVTRQAIWGILERNC
jgi:DNA-binding XRE family transcriptional regulator